MKVLIVNSPLFREINKLYDEDSLPPLGLGMIATRLKENGIDVQLIDAIYERISLKKLIVDIERLKPDFIASNIFTTNKELVQEMVEAITFNAHFIIGGLSTKQLYKEIVNWNTTNNIDIVTGDGELITVDIVKNRLKETPQFQQDNKRWFMVDSNSIYEVKDISSVRLDRSFFKNEPVPHPLGFKEANIVTSRGCVYNCTFCAAARSLNKNYAVRELSAGSIINELHEIRTNYPEVNSIRVLDDLFLKRVDCVKKAIRVFSNFDFQWRSMAHVLTFNKVDDGTMQKLGESGCYELFIGIESGSPKILNAINKTKNIEKIVENLEKVFSTGINIKGYFIYGFPDETQDDMELTFQLACRLKQLSSYYGVNFRTSVFQFRPYHGTQIYHDLEIKGKNLNVRKTKPDKDLSNLVGRLQFNFHSGNYSSVAKEMLNDYIYRTTNLNDGKIFAKLETQSTTIH